MLVLGNRLQDMPVMSLQTGSQLAKIGAPIIDPTNLKIVAYVVDGPLLSEQPSLLRTADIREMGSVGMIVDSSDEFIGPHDVIKIEELILQGYTPLDKQVVDEHGHKLGKVENYTLETQSFLIQQLHVRRGILRGIMDTGPLIHRSQIVEINDKSIVVKGTTKKLVQPVMQPEQREYVNPFRKPAPQPEPET